MSPRAVAFTAPVLLLLLAGCSADPASSNPQTVDATSTTIAATEYAFEPHDITVPAGDVMFTIRNEGSEEHEFEILRGDRVIDEAAGLIPGLERDLDRQRLTEPPRSRMRLLPMPAARLTGLRPRPPAVRGMPCARQRRAS